MKLALKELRESRVWLLILKKTGAGDQDEAVGALLDEVNQLISIFVKSIATARSRKTSH